MTVDLQIKPCKSLEFKRKAVNYTDQHHKDSNGQQTNKIPSHNWDHYVEISYSRNGTPERKIFLLWVYKSDSYRFFFFENSLYLMTWNNRTGFIDLDRFLLDENRIEGIKYTYGKVNENDLENEFLKLKP